MTTALTSGKYLTFMVEGRLYGLPILKVKEILEVGEITPLPGMPGFVRGVINIRGKVMPAVDLSLLFGGQKTGLGGRACIIVMEVAQGGRTQEVGFIAEGVREVRDIEVGDIEPSPNFNSGDIANAIEGVAKADDRLVVLLKGEALLCGYNLTSLTDAEQLGALTASA